MKPIYKPKGAAAEYGEWALNIYQGCPHTCWYCFAPNVLHKVKDTFHAVVEPRKNIVEETAKQLDSEDFSGKTIHLCFTCDPFPKGCDSTPTREIIKLIKDHGAHVQILTKNGEDAMRDFDLLDGDDWFGITYAGYSLEDYNESSPEAEPGSGSIAMRLMAIIQAHMKGIKTWVSCEPVLNAEDVLAYMGRFDADLVDLWKIGKLNYHPSDIDWKKFGHDVENLCKELGRKYYIKESLRKEMEK